MPYRAPRVCGCGFRVAAGAQCACEAKRKALSEKARPTARQRGYTAEWEKEAAAFLKAHPICVRPGCGKPSKAVDHIIPHRGNMRLFWSRSNWQPLCTKCHNGWKQSLEKRGASATSWAR